MRSLALVLSLAAAFAAVLPARAAEKIVIGQTAAHDYLPAIVAREKGFFAAHGIDAEITIPPAPPTIFSGIVGGSIQLGTSTGPQLALANEAGADVVVVAGGAFETRQRPSIMVVASPASNIKQAQDFRGRRVIVPGINSAYHLMFQRWLLQQGADPKSVIYVEGGFPQMADLLRGNQVDAALPTEPFTSRMIDGGSGVRVADYFVDVRSDVFVTFYAGSRIWVAEHGAAVAGFRAALAEGFAFIRDNPAEAKAIEAGFLKLPPGVLDKLGPPNARLAVTADDLQFWLDVSRDLGLVKPGLDATTMMAP